MEEQRASSNNGIDDDGNGYVEDIRGIDFVDGDIDPRHDPHGHGTHVAGIIAATGKKHEAVVGVSWKAKLMNLRFMDSDGGGYTSDAATAIVYGVRHGVHAIHASGPYKQRTAKQTQSPTQSNATSRLIFSGAAVKDAEDIRSIVELSGRLRLRRT